MPGRRDKAKHLMADHRAAQNAFQGRRQCVENTPRLPSAGVRTSSPFLGEGPPVPFPDCPWFTPTVHPPRVSAVVGVTEKAKPSGNIPPKREGPETGKTLVHCLLWGNGLIGRDVESLRCCMVVQVRALCMGFIISVTNAIPVSQSGRLAPGKSPALPPPLGK